MAWAAARGVRLLLNNAGSLTQNAYIESFNGKFRDECLNEQWFETLAQARQEVAHWRCKAITGDQVVFTILDSLTQRWHV